MDARVLITGGAGFIGSHLADELLAAGHAVRVLDSLVEQVHPERTRPAYLDPAVELVAGDVRDPEAVRRALVGVDRVVHLAARVGVGQSMYDLHEYASTNTTGTAVLLEALLDSPVRKLVVASSMSVYGEGMYVDAEGRLRPAVERVVSGRGFEPVDEIGRALTPVSTPETKVPALSSVYALTKYDQERLCLIFGAAYGVPTVALRFFNTYGTRQALSNPYTGVLAIFASRLLNAKPPLVFEDGLQRRDFVAVADVARACRLALEGDGGDGHAINVGTGADHTVNDVAAKLARVLGRELGPELTGEVRAGDVRHCWADIGPARRLLGYEPSRELDDGLVE